jgi:ParB family chromosome partitioning protein
MELPESIRHVLDSKPSLITLSYAKPFVDLSRSNEASVVEVVKQMAEEGIQQEQAIRLINSKIAALAGSRNRVQPEKFEFQGLGNMKVKGNKLEVACAKGIDPDLLRAKLEAFLKDLDLKTVTQKQSA